MGGPAATAPVGSASVGLLGRDLLRHALALLLALAVAWLPAAPALALAWKRSVPASSVVGAPATPAGLQEIAPPLGVQQLRPLLMAHQPSLRILAPQADSLMPAGPWTLQLELSDWPLLDAGAGGLGPHLVVQLDDDPPLRLTSTSIAMPALAPGSHRLSVFAALPWGEAMHNPGAFAQIRLHRAAANPLAGPAPGTPQLIPLLPVAAVADQPLLIDWILVDAPLQHLRGGDDSWRLQISLDGESLVLDRQEALWLRGLRPGAHPLLLELVDPRGEPLNPPFNSLVRELVTSADDAAPPWLAGPLSSTELARLSGSVPPPAEATPEDEPQAASGGSTPPPLPSGGIGLHLEGSTASVATQPAPLGASAMADTDAISGTQPPSEPALASQPGEGAGSLKGMAEIGSTASSPAAPSPTAGLAAAPRADPDDQPLEDRAGSPQPDTEQNATDQTALATLGEPAVAKPGEMTTLPGLPVISPSTGGEAPEPEPSPTTSAELSGPAEASDDVPNAAAAASDFASPRTAVQDNPPPSAPDESGLASQPSATQPSTPEPPRHASEAGGSRADESQQEWADLHSATTGSEGSAKGAFAPRPPGASASRDAPDLPAQSQGSSKIVQGRSSAADAEPSPTQMDNGNAAEPSAVASAARLSSAVDAGMAERGSSSRSVNRTPPTPSLSSRPSPPEPFDPWSSLLPADPAERSRRELLRSRDSAPPWHGLLDPVRRLAGR